ncbi:CinA family protein [Corynebacterium atypicum]|uniref:CinA family protein n=1 Tax=Corynebacterium atypicum TaxID=191610 RepID=UPI000A01BD18
MATNSCSSSQWDERVQPAQLTELARCVIEELCERGETLGLCESLTAGLACATLASVPGASAVLRGGLVTYATDLKQSLALVDAAVLAQFGPVAAETARQMARGASRQLGCDWAVSLTGVAGPSKQDGHPVGEVWLGLFPRAR